MTAAPFDGVFDGTPNVPTDTPVREATTLEAEQIKSLRKQTEMFECQSEALDQIGALAEDLRVRMGDEVEAASIKAADQPSLDERRRWQAAAIVSNVNQGNWACQPWALQEEAATWAAWFETGEIKGLVD